MPGGSGHVGQSLRRHFEANGHEVLVISRSGSDGWDGKSLGPWTSKLEGSDVVINLSGRSVNCRYNRANLDEMMASRVNATRVIGEAIRQCTKPPKVWINSSTATIYQHRFDAPNDDHTGILGSEADRMPAKWLASVNIAIAWEEALWKAEVSATRKIAIRSAMVMAPIDGSIFAVLVGLARRGLMGTQAGGKQYVSWIHEQDFCRAIDWIVEHSDMQSPINVTSPNPLPQREFAKILRDAVGAKIGLPATRWMLELGAIGMRTETELLLKSRRVVPSLLLESGFKFDFPHWTAASRDLVAKLVGSGR